MFDVLDLMWLYDHQFLVGETEMAFQSVMHTRLRNRLYAVGTTFRKQHVLYCV